MAKKRKIPKGQVPHIEAAKKAAARRRVSAAVEAPVVGSRFRRALTDDEMDRIADALEAGGGGPYGPARALIAVWDVILGDAEGCTFAEAEARDAGLRPNDYAIPRSQANEIVESWKVGRSSRVSRSIGLSWHNRGPAVYDPEPVTAAAAD